MELPVLRGVYKIESIITTARFSTIIFSIIVYRANDIAWMCVQS